MIFFTEVVFEQLSIHSSGNKALGEPYQLSDHPFTISDETLANILARYFLTPFEKVQEVHHFFHPTDNLGLNTVYSFADKIFEDPSTLHVNSGHIIEHLYDVSGHPNIKAGEVYVAYFKNLQIEGSLHDAIGIFKSETKETYLTVAASPDGFKVGYEQDAINIKKLDKGCLIFNTDKDDGYKVAMVDQTNKTTDAVYWVDDFLKLKVRNDEYSQTTATLQVYKNFVAEKLEQSFDLSKTDKIDLLNRSMKYFKEKDTFDMNEFGNEVINNEKGIEAFREYKTGYETEFGTALPDSFSISNAAVKKQARIFKSVLKLDKNFHVYIHGNNDLIDKGFDEKVNMNYYKLYFREEN